jgi:histidyl-tRNA synthetase
MQTLPQPVRLFYIGAQFRYERPQKGRFRQFHQIGAELLGGRGAESDVEVLLLLVRFLKELGFRDLQVLLNTVGDSESRELYRHALRTYLLPLREKLSEESRRRLESNPLRILDTKSPEEQELLKSAPKLADSLTESSRAHFERVLSSLEAFRLSFRIEERLVRGLDYYTNTVFEIVSEGLGAQNAICGGGAYEDLVEELGGPKTYGVGFAIGQDRLIEVLPDDSPARRESIGPVLIRAVLTRSAERGKDAEIEAAGLRLADELRSLDVPAIYLGVVEPKRAYAEAEQLGSTRIVTIGEDELRDGTLTMRDVQARVQKNSAREGSLLEIRKLFDRAR